MNPYQNLPPGVTNADIGGPEMPRCQKCGCEFNPFDDEKHCEDCSPEEPLEEHARMESDGLRKEITRLRTERNALLFYARHEPSCPIPYAMCDCGLQNLLNGLKK